ncbi:hypothetical protein SAPIO_CDS1702 [Scedosporium apiospermum]|uniref:PCI domain-containing protein n=1 Tax=Pseudallescheria apiosperma TaxID=563466 RepID=A0A084GDJ8_PSEDA|nr:uncharacterized protein SAPIO_CDS1702 [Scedosporium apiospermum]KEZ45410.1 hypothetical protein SAPIO_CDS1702 [Scedosporium apiospermum]
MGSGENLEKVEAFFAELASEGRTIVREQPKLDLELYLQNYKGRTRFDRLYHIGRTSVVLSVDALKAAVAEAKAGKDVERYRDVVDALRRVSLSDPETELDKAWIEKTSSANKKETQHLESQLKVYRSNLVKESVRIGNEDLGRHYEAIGALAKASEVYGNMRTDASTPKHLIDVGKHLVRVGIQMRDWTTVTLQLGKLLSLQTQEVPEDATATLRYVNIAKGLAHLEAEAYKEAAQCFLSVDNNPRLASEPDIPSPNDIAVYGAILALATMDRSALKTKVLESQTFRPFLELEPHLRKALGLYVNGKYTACLEILDSCKPDHLLDIYLYKHVASLYKQIRTKCIVQYLIPYACIKLENLEAAFGKPGQSLGAELCEMIRSGVLSARIDSIDKRDTLEAVKWHQKRTLDDIRRNGLLALHVDIALKRHGSLRLGDSQGLDEVWYTEGRDPMDLAT